MFNENPSLHSLNSSHTITCNFCGKYGHTEAVCFHKVGFPGNIKTSKFSFTRKVCTFCNRLGHTVDTCYKKHGFPPVMGKFMHTVTYEMHGLGCIELIIIISIRFPGNLWIRCRSLVRLT